MAKQLFSLMVEEVSFVDRGAIGETFAVTKAADAADEDGEDPMPSLEDIKKAIDEAFDAKLAVIVQKSADTQTQLSEVVGKLEEVEKAFDMHKALMAEAAQAAKEQVDTISKLAAAGASWSDVWDARDKLDAILNRMAGYATVASGGSSTEMSEVAKAAPVERADSPEAIAKALVAAAEQLAAVETVAKALSEKDVALTAEVATLTETVAKAQAEIVELTQKNAALEAMPKSNAPGGDSPKQEPVKKSVFSSLPLIDTKP